MNCFEKDSSHLKCRFCHSAWSLRRNRRIHWQDIGPMPSVRGGPSKSAGIRLKWVLSGTPHPPLQASYSKLRRFFLAWGSGWNSNFRQGSHSDRRAKIYFLVVTTKSLTQEIIWEAAKKSMNCFEKDSSHLKCRFCHSAWSRRRNRRIRWQDIEPSPSVRGGP